MTDLFLPGPFRAHSGSVLPFKIDCGALTDADLATLAEQVAEQTAFSRVIGVPRGGLRFAATLEKYAEPAPSDITLIVDDVLTTGNSMADMRLPWLKGPCYGVVIFARGPCPDWVRPIFTLAEWMR